MSKQIAAVFREEEGALEAAQMLSDAGYTPSDLSVFSRYGLRYPHLPLMATPVFVERFVKRPEKALGRALHGAIIGGFALGMIEQFGIWDLAGEWQDVISFVVLIVFLSLWPQGLLPRK